MGVRVDVDLRQQFERAAVRSSRPVDEVTTALMEDYAAQAPSTGFRGNLTFDFGPEFDLSTGQGAKIGRSILKNI